jgi:hypothetical protein
MFTLHSWLGLSFVILFGLQLLLGFFAFVVKILPASKVLPLHKASGVILLSAIGN